VNMASKRWGEMNGYDTSTFGAWYAWERRPMHMAARNPATFSFADFVNMAAGAHLPNVAQAAAYIAANMGPQPNANAMGNAAIAGPAPVAMPAAPIPPTTMSAMQQTLSSAVQPQAVPTLGASGRLRLLPPFLLSQKSSQKSSQQYVKLSPHSMTRTTTNSSRSQARLTGSSKSPSC